MKPTINIISFYFEVENTPRSFRTYELTKGFCEAGFRVRLIVPNFNKHLFTHANLEIIDTPVGPILKKTTDKRLPALVSTELSKPIQWACAIGQKFLFPDMNALWVHNALNFLRQHQVDLEAEGTLAIAQPLAPMVLAAALKQTGRRVGNLLVEYGDPTIYPPGILNQFKAQREAELLQLFDAIVINFPGAKESFAKLGVSSSKIHIVPHILPTDTAPTKWKRRNEETTAYIYGGALYGDRDISKLLLAIRKLREEGGKQTLTLFTSTESLSEDTRKQEGDYLILREKVTPEEYRKNLLNFDAAVNFIPSKSIHLPSKRMDLAMAEIPVLEIRYEDTAEDLVHKMRTGQFTKLSCDDACTRSEAIAHYSEILTGTGVKIEEQPRYEYSS
ncbi:MAG: hypothetical protein KDD51_17120 [Bdellovibrionales bacterium]|nr:hypothetical protein [Bdellovibrionales bacterium]